MPNSFQFISKATGEAEKFASIDDKLCAFLAVVPSPTKYYRGWYDNLGYAAAIGMSWASMRESAVIADDTDLIRVIDWFAEHYTISAWYSP